MLEGGLGGISLCMINHRPTSVRKDTMMKAFTLDSFDTPPGLREDLPAPAPADNEVLVRVHASSVNPVDGAIAAGMMSTMVEHEFPVVLGRDYAGVIERVGSDVTRYVEGDEVYGFLPHANPTVHDGTWTELIVVPEDNFVARKPASAELTAAGAAPLAGISAMSALDALEISEGDTILVIGANGGVGSFAVQLAANAGATVIAPALPEDEDYLRDLGVSELLERDADIERRGWRRSAAHQRHSCADPGEPGAPGAAAGHRHPQGAYPEHLLPRSGRGGHPGVRHCAHPG